MVESTITPAAKADPAISRAVSSMPCIAAQPPTVSNSPRRHIIPAGCTGSEPVVQASINAPRGSPPAGNGTGNSPSSPEVSKSRAGPTAKPASGCRRNAQASVARAVGSNSSSASRFWISSADALPSATLRVMAGRSRRSAADRSPPNTRAACLTRLGIRRSVPARRSISRSTPSRWQCHSPNRASC